MVIAFFPQRSSRFLISTEPTLSPIVTQLILIRFPKNLCNKHIQDFPDSHFSTFPLKIMSSSSPIIPIALTAIVASTISLVVSHLLTKSSNRGEIQHGRQVEQDPFQTSLVSSSSMEASEIFKQVKEYRRKIEVLLYMQEAVVNVMDFTRVLR